MAKSAGIEPDETQSHFKTVIDERHMRDADREALGVESVRYHLEQSLKGDVSADFDEHVESALRQLEAEYGSSD